MRLSRAHDVLTSALASMMLTAAFLKASSSSSSYYAAAAGPLETTSAVENALMLMDAAGLRGALPDVPPAAPPPPAAAAYPHEESPATPAQLAKVTSFIKARGSTSTIDKSVTDALGLTKDAATLTVPQLVVTNGDGIAHAFSPLEDGGYLLARLVRGADLAYRVGKDLAPSGAVVKKKGVAPVAMAQENARRESREELAFWADASEQLPPQ